MPIPIAARRHLVRLQNPGTPVSDGDGGFTQAWTDLAPPSVYVQIAPASAKDLERIASGTVLTTATHVVTGPFHPDVTTKTRVVFGDRTFSVTGVSSPEERQIEMVLVCVEVVR
jgi:SPP1 family predicted phage head-tail adaptor